MQHIRLQVRTRITYVHLGNCLLVATPSVEIDALSSEKQNSPQEGSIDGAIIPQVSQNPTASRSDTCPVATESTVHRLAYH
ncbi:hypothetical protein LAZ67_20000965 [Cordylochernes scorpioides]|uniref:Uncharacterized protein n=1 Tax=Cordylochernes scorpioides TaxID=51811 RepID=A0ABY6LJK0_9ARAC|nr:hypothetical protein LAZ67_20000965 [Cordylochernes scorpioides]